MSHHLNLRYAAGDERIKNEDMLEEVEDGVQCAEYLMLASLQLLLLVKNFCQQLLPFRFLLFQLLLKKS